MTTLNIIIPDELARGAGAAGLLDPAAIQELLRDDLRAKTCDGLKALWGKLKMVSAAKPLRLVNRSTVRGITVPGITVPVPGNYRNYSTDSAPDDCFSCLPAICIRKGDVE